MAKSGEQPDRNRTESGQNQVEPDRIRTESGQNATMLYVIPSCSKECQGAVFSQFSTYRPCPLGKSMIASRGIKTPKNRETMPPSRQRSRTKQQFHSTWWFAGWPSRRGNATVIHFVEFCCYRARRVSLQPSAVQERKKKVSRHEGPTNTHSQTAR